MPGTLALTWFLALPLVGSPVVYLAGRTAVLRGALTGIARWLALAIMLAAAVPLYLLASAFLATGVPLEVSLGTIALQLDGISLVMIAAIWGLGTLVVLYSGPYVAGEAHEEKYYALLIAMLGSMIGLCCARDLFNLWVWFEVMAISSYLLVAFYRSLPASLEAGVKYLVQSATGSALVMIGISLVLAQTGTLDLREIRQMVPAGNTLLMTAGALFLIGFGVKAALVPLHTWLPDAHSQAPSGISALLSGVVIEVGLIALLRAVGAVSHTTPNFASLLIGFGVANMLLGNLMALRQTQVKRLLAFSSLAHMGYILFGLGVAVAFKQPDAAAGSFFHIITHALMKGLAFLAAGAFLYGLHLARGHHNPLVVDDLNGAAQRYPLAAFAFSLAVLGLGGLPPLAGFMSKWQIFAGSVAPHHPVVTGLVIFAALNSVVSLGYYAPLVNRIYRNQPAAVVSAGAAMPWQIGLPLLVLVLAVVLLGFFPSLAEPITAPAAAALLGSIGY